VDLTSSRIFVRDQEANLISVFGGYGRQRGTFNTPVAVECYGQRVYVLDRLKNNVTVFEPTEYGSLVRQAVIAYDLGNYAEAELLWKQVLARNANATLAYNGIGKALAQENRYEESMEYLRYSGDRYSYSRSFGKNRLELVRNYGVYFIGAVALVAVVGYVVKRRRKE
jgi:tetratricopeptide (TPR) repeat protein